MTQGCYYNSTEMHACNFFKYYFQGFVAAQSKLLLQ